MVLREIIIKKKTTKDARLTRFNYFGKGIETNVHKEKPTGNYPQGPGRKSC